jgi:lysophospholipase L1-like esterase
MKLKLSLITIVMALVAFKPVLPKKTINAEPYLVLHPRNGIANFFNKLSKGSPVTIAYLGGSITAAAGYRVQTEELFKHQYLNCKINCINAGVGGTGSPLGVFRVDEEVLQYNPDLVFIEFAVNDGSTDSLAVGRAVEGIVRKIKKHDPGTDICFLYTVNEGMVKDVPKKKLASSIRFMEGVANYYGLTSINLGPDVYEQLIHNKLVFKGTENDVKPGQILFTKDGVHPTTEGHTIYTHTIETSFEQLKLLPAAKQVKLPKPLFKDNYEFAQTYPPQAFNLTAGWQKANGQAVLSSLTTALPNMVYANSVNDSVTIKFKGSFLGIEDIIGPSTSAVSISIDGKTPITKLRFDGAGTFYRRHYFYLDTLTDTDHQAIIKLAALKVDKFKVLKITPPADSAKYIQNNIYIGNVLLINTDKPKKK